MTGEASVGWAVLPTIPPSYIDSTRCMGGQTAHPTAPINHRAGGQTAHPTVPLNHRIGGQTAHPTLLAEPTFGRGINPLRIDPAQPDVAMDR